MKQKYKLIAFDIDGTIKTTDKDVSRDIISAIYKANQLGAKVTVITGRAYLSAKEVISKIGLSAPIVTFQGAHIADPYTDKVHWKKSLDKSSIDELIQILKNYEEEILFYTEKEIYTNKISDWNTAYSRRNNSNLIVLNNFNELLDKEIIRITVICPYGAKEFTNSLLRQSKGKLYVTTSLANFCEILHPRAGKKHGLQMLSSFLEIDRKNILSFGNGIEDLPMLEWSGCGVIVDDHNTNLPMNSLEYCDPAEDNGPAIYMNKLMDQDLVGI